jgi:hypothetical protein
MTDTRRLKRQKASLVRQLFTNQIHEIIPRAAAETIETRFEAALR